MDESNNKGFTLVELIVVIVILAILIGVTIGGIYMYVGQSRVATDEGNASSISGVLSTLAVERDVYQYGYNNDCNIILHWEDAVPNSEITTESTGLDSSIVTYINKVLTNGLPDSKTGKGFDLQIKIVKGTNPDILVNCKASSSGGINDDDAVIVEL